MAFTDCPSSPRVSPWVAEAVKLPSAVILADNSPVARETVFCPISHAGFRCGSVISFSRKVKRIQQHFELDAWRLEGVLNQLARGTLNRYLLILKRLIFESSVRAGSPSFAAAPDGPETCP